MKEFVYTMTTTFAEEWWTDIMNNIDDTYFVWIDDVDAPNTTSPFYYIIKEKSTEHSHSHSHNRF